MSDKNKNSISIANYIALIGMAGIGVTTFFGELFSSKDALPGLAILLAITQVAVLTFILVFSIKAKKKDSDTKSWFFVEISCVILYIVVALSLSAPSQRFFYIVSEKDNLKEMAKAEIKAIDTMYMKYEGQCKRFITNAVEQINNYYDSKSINRELSDFLKEAGISNKKEVERWEEKALKIMELPKNSQLSEIKSEVEIWNLLTLPSLAVNLEETAKKAWSDVRKHIQKATEENKLIPVIGGTLGDYFFDGYADFDLGTQPEAKFAKALREAEGSTTTGWIIYIILNFMVMFNYIVTNRSNKVTFTKRDTPGTGL